MLEDAFADLYSQMIRDMEKELIPKRIIATEEVVDFIVATNREDYNIDNATLFGASFVINNGLEDTEILHTKNVNILDFIGGFASK